MVSTTDDTAAIILQMGKEEPQPTQWSLSTNHEGAFYLGLDVNFIAELLLVDRFVVQAAPAHGEDIVITAVFNVVGLAEAIEPLRDACNW